MIDELDISSIGLRALLYQSFYMNLMKKEEHVGEMFSFPLFDFNANYSFPSPSFFLLMGNGEMGLLLHLHQYIYYFFIIIRGS